MPSSFTVAIGDQQTSLTCLDPNLDAEFDRFYQSIFAPPQPDASAFDAAASHFFDLEAASAEAADAFFNNFTPLWRLLLDQGRFFDASSLWDWALRPASDWETRNQRRLHKGGAFYYAGMTAILSRDIDGGYLFMHRALEEDLASHGVFSPTTPAYSLVTMDSSRVDQAFGSWVSAKAEFVSAELGSYRAAYGRGLDFAALHARFLARPDLRDAAFLFSYSVARLLRICQIGPETFSSAFGGQLAVNLLFDVALVVDALVRPLVPATQWRFIDLAYALSSNAGLGLSRQNLEEIRRLFVSDFNGTVVKCLDRTMALSNGTTLSRPASNLALAYGCRNRGAHDVSSVTAFRERFDDARAALLHTVFLAVEVLH